MCQPRGWASLATTAPLVITHAGKPLGTFVPTNRETLRPHFANLHAPGGTQVTRNQPQVPGQLQDV